MEEKTGSKHGFLSASVFPLLGAGDDYYKLVDINNKNQLVEDAEFEIELNKKRSNNPYSKSEYTNDHIITAHPRFETFTSHCRLRNGKNPCILVPIYNDENTYLNFENLKKEEYDLKYSYNELKYSRINNSYCSKYMNKKIDIDLNENSLNNENKNSNTNMNMNREVIEIKEENKKDKDNNKLTNIKNDKNDKNDKNPENNIKPEKYPGFIHMDSFTSGMGNGCMQVTFGLNNLNEALYIYDQFIPCMPLLLSLSASSSIVKGKLSGWDNRFNILAQACDDRTDDEKDPKSEKYIYKSRYSNVYSYISCNPYIQDHHNEYPKMPIDKEYYKKLTDKGFNTRFAEYICNLFVREPMIVFEKKIEVEKKEDPTHFISFMSTNWNSIRFKPPLENDKDKFYKLEIRPCDLQFSPFENAAITTFIILYSRILRNYDINFIIPMSMNDTNFEKAHFNNAASKEKFFWRVNGITKEYEKWGKYVRKGSFCNSAYKVPEGYESKEKDLESIKELTVDEILNGNEEYGYVGLLKIMKFFVINRYKEHQHELLLGHLDFLSDRAKGKLLTGAQYVRKLVLNHPKYKKDSVVSQEIAYDVAMEIVDIQTYKHLPKEMFEGYEELINKYKVNNDDNMNIEKVDSGKKLKRDLRKCSLD